MRRYLDRVEVELDRGPSPSLICNDMVAAHGPFKGPARHQFCTGVVAQVAQLVDELLREQGIEHDATPVTLPDGDTWQPGE